ncbi:sensor histidine kinase [Streptomyces sulphureus]|uniref:sensor histidine kinase n=1 Tax=Streptomyces sulphureus TaxID=47758 RepID=UPI000381E324|nr:histidine kinase [Streptomyces sulphureus]
MRRREDFPWAAYGRRALILVLVLNAVQSASVAADGAYLTWRTAVALLCGAALLVRRLPWLVAPVSTTVATGAWGWPMLPLLLVALFDLAARRRPGWAVCCGVAVMVANSSSPEPESLWRPQQYGSTLFLLLAVVGGLWVGSRHRLVELLNSQVERLRVERELREEAARAAERSRVAAEMHDVLAHRLSLIALHSGVLATKSDALPEPVAERLALLRTTSTEALSDLRDVLGALHTPDAAGTAPVLRDVRELVAQARQSQHVELDIAGRAEEAPAAHRLAVYRLVQEGLTNARKHAAGSPVHIRLDYRPPDTTVEVTNRPGTSAALAEPSGFGLVGLRERVSALGGELSAGPHGSGGWRLAARIAHHAPDRQGSSRT